MQDCPNSVRSGAEVTTGAAIACNSGCSYEGLLSEVNVRLGSAQIHIIHNFRVLYIPTQTFSRLWDIPLTSSIKFMSIKVSDLPKNDVKSVDQLRHYVASRSLVHIPAGSLSAIRQFSASGVTTWPHSSSACTDRRAIAWSGLQQALPGE